MSASTTTIQPTEDLDKHLEHYVQAFNSNDPDLLEQFYTEEAIAVWEPHTPLQGEARREAAREFLSRKPTMTAVERERYVTNDTILFIVDWQIDMTGADGEPEHLEGVGVDVVRKGADGKWRYAVDDAYGGNAPA
ncbi:YybH family protein [Actinosynnema sp. NPDC053489]|uniref:YybH family protein n=1 Tax=Actinosynnema sp. NPDC053489 TaxID=3363916 RepID=UPI0037CB0AE8